VVAAGLEQAPEWPVYLRLEHPRPGRNWLALPMPVLPTDLLEQKPVLPLAAGCWLVDLVSCNHWQAAALPGRTVESRQTLG
jgi:hypothetical protein